VSWLGLTAIQAMTAGPDVGFPWVTSGVVVAAAIALLTRAGLVALMAAALVLLLLTASPLTSDFTAWYAPSCLFAVGLSGLLLVYGFFTARAGHPFPWWRLLDAE
jgi:hypothetical protein